jgi:UTP--glucose-1-phosphate uridylyltransferase
MAKKVLKAVIPAAGRGIRMRPFSLVLPKELMPLGRKTMIQFAIEEAIAAGIQEICIVVRRGKEIIREYLCHPELERLDGLRRTGVRSWKLTFAQQMRWDGLGGALRAAEAFVGQDPFLMIIPDQLLIARQLSASQQLLSQYDFKGPVVLSSMVRIPKREGGYFHGSRGFVVDMDAKRSAQHRLLAIVRLRSEAETRRSFSSLPYEIRGFGRTIFPAQIFPFLSRNFANRKTGEIDLWSTFTAFPKVIPHFGLLLRGRACDLGTLDSYYHYLPPFVGQ